MSEQNPSAPGSDAGADSSTSSALFAQLVLQQTNMALMFLGKVAHPETGQTYKDVEGARLFIDQLEMLEAKTKGNLTKEESGLLKQSLMNLRLAFVEAVNEPDASAAAPPAPAGPSTEGSSSSQPAGTAATPGSAEEHRKKFSKKY